MGVNPCSCCNLTPREGAIQVALLNFLFFTITFISVILYEAIPLDPFEAFQFDKLHSMQDKTEIVLNLIAFLNHWTISLIISIMNIGSSSMLYFAVENDSGVVLANKKLKMTIICWFVIDTMTLLLYIARATLIFIRISKLEDEESDGNFMQTVDERYYIISGVYYCIRILLNIYFTWVVSTYFLKIVFEEGRIRRLSEELNRRLLNKEWAHKGKYNDHFRRLIDTLIKMKKGEDNSIIAEHKSKTRIRNSLTTMAATGSKSAFNGLTLSN